MKKRSIGEKEIKGALEELLRFRRGKEELMARIAEEKRWFRMRYTPRAHANSEGERFAPTSAWLFNAIVQKHADMMDNMPTAVCLAREESDVAAAEALSVVLPVVLERSRFAGVYADNMWQKLCHGLAAYGVFWNNEAENGLGDVEVRGIDIEQLYWQNGVKNLQDSPSVFMVATMEKAALRARFPRYNMSDDVAELGSTVSDEGKPRVTVVDWYYKKRTPDGRTLLHYCKFAGDTVLFASENDPLYENGWYEHGSYPFVLDLLYPTPDATGFGMIAIAKDPQGYIDRMDRNLLEYMDWATRVRYFCKKNAGLNERDFSDLSRRIVEVEGDLGEERVRQIEVADIGSRWLDMKEAKIKELKEATNSPDVARGSADGSVTAASAIAALQEAANKVNRDIISASYRAFVDVVGLVIECVRQFYTEARHFRILGEDGRHRYMCFDNRAIIEESRAKGDESGVLYRRPVFDIDVRAEKQDAFSRTSHNQMMMELYRLGVFDPARGEEAELLLSNMDFAGVDRLRAQLRDMAAKEEKTLPVSGENPIMGQKNGTDRAVRTAVRAAERGSAL